MKYWQLNQKNDEYDETLTRKLDLLYKGGQEIVDNANLFIPQEIGRGEPSLLYHERLKAVSYRNYLAKIINDYVSDLFGKPFSVVPAADASDSSTPGDNVSEEEPFYKEFSEDVDLQNHNLAYVLSCMTTDALTIGRAYLGIDFPKVDESPRNIRDEEDTDAARAYVYEVPTLSVIDWNKDDFGKFIFLVLKNVDIPRKTFADSRDKQVISFKVWEKQDNGTITWKLFEIITKIGKEPQKNDDVPLVAEGVVSFKDIPILCLDIPFHLWIGNLVGNMCIEHFRRNSSLVYAQGRNLFPIPVYKQGAEIMGGDKPALSVLGTDENRGVSTTRAMQSRGYAVIGPEDDISYVEPAGKIYEIVNTQLKELVDSIHEVCNQMAITAMTNARGSMGKSGLSKMMDNHGKELVLYAYANLIKDFATTLYTVISEGRNENIVWRTVGFDNFAILDRDSLVKEVQANLQIPSKTFRKHYLLNLAHALAPDLDAQASDTIEDEIDEAVEKEPTPEEKRAQEQADKDMANKVAMAKKSNAGNAKVKKLGD